MSQLRDPLLSGPPAFGRPGPVSPLRRVKQWDLVQLVAESSLAQVYRARPSDSRTDLPAGYALKVLRPQWEHDPRAVELFRQEARVARAVRHPHVIAVLASALAQPPYYLVMPWLNGTTLRQQLQPRNNTGGRSLPLHMALWITRQTAAALDALYRHGWMHGDVKPSNLMLAPEGHVTLLDLGFARPALAPSDAVDCRRLQPVEAAVMGTCSYLAPEVLSPWVPAGIHSDLYSLGVVLYEMLAGRLPFATRNTALLAAAHKQDVPPPLERLARGTRGRRPPGAAPVGEGPVAPPRHAGGVDPGRHPAGTGRHGSPPRRAVPAVGLAEEYVRQSGGTPWKGVAGATAGRAEPPRPSRACHPGEPA